MTAYHIYQPHLTDAQVRELNASGWDAKPEFRLYSKLTGGFDVQARDYYAAAALGIMKHMWTVETDDIKEVFVLANYMPGRGTATKISPQAKSMSVGDVAVYADPDTILGWSGRVCARMGFNWMNGIALRKMMEECPMVRDGRGEVVTPEVV